MIRYALPLLVLTGCGIPSGSATPTAKGSPGVIHVVASPELIADEAFARGEAAVRDALRAVSGGQSIRVEVVLATNAPDLASDGFSLRTPPSEDGVVEVRGREVRGLVYGLHELSHLTRLGRWKPGTQLEVTRNPAFDLRLCSMHDNPGEPPFVTRFRDPEVVLDLGFNGIILHGLAALCLYEGYDPRLVPLGSNERAAVIAARAPIRDLITRAKRNHLVVFLNGDELCLPVRAVELYGNGVLTDPRPNGERPISPSKPKVHDLIRATFEEVLSLFPEIDGVQVRMGEVYTQSEPMLVGNPPDSGTDETCKDWTPEDRIRALHRTIADVVCGKYGKKFNLRMWDYYVTAHSVPERWLEFSDPIEPSGLTTFSFKHPKTDYWRWNPINPNFGLGHHTQWAEFQMAREYEGKGAFPSYLGRYFAQGPTECSPTGGLAVLHEKGVRAAWCWARGGGQRGPFPAREDWIALNIYAFVRLLWDPREDPWELAAEWAALELDLPLHSQASERFVRIQQLSEEAVLASRYLGAVIEKGHFKRGSGWTPDGNWSRDDKIGVKAEIAPAKAFYNFLKADGTLAKAIAEREQALGFWKSLVDEFDALVEEVGASADLRELSHTALYGKRLFDATNHSFLAGWMAYSWDDAGRKDADLARQASEHLAAAREAWRDYRERVCLLPGVATPYEEYGFSSEWNAIAVLLD